MDSRQQFELKYPVPFNADWSDEYQRYIWNKKDNSLTAAIEHSKLWEAWQASRESLVIDMRYAAKKWFYESFDDELLEKMQSHGLIAQAEGFSISVMAELELEMESAMNTNGIRTK